VFGVCWDSPWYRTLPDQAVLRLRRIGLTATLTMRVTQWLPLVGWCHVTTGLATVRGLGTIYLDDVDLEHLAEPVQVRIARHKNGTATVGLPRACTQLCGTKRLPEPDAGTALANTHPHLTHEQACSGEFDLHVDSVTLHGLPGARGAKFIAKEHDQLLILS